MADVVKTVKQSGGDYSTLESCLAANEQDLTSTAGNFYADIEGAWTADDTTKVDVGGWTTNATYKVIIRANDASSKHGNTPDGGYRLKPTSSGHAITLNQAYTVIQGIEICLTSSGGNSDEGVRCGDNHDNSVIDGCLIHSEDTNNDQDGIYQTNPSSQIQDSILYIYNCHIYGFTRAGIHQQLTVTSSPARTVRTDIRSCSIHNCGSSGEGSSGAIHIEKARAETYVYSYMTIYDTITADTASTFLDIDSHGTYTADINWTVNYNVSTDGSAAGANSITNATVTESTTPGAGTWISVVDKDSPYDWDLLDDDDNDMMGAGSAANQPPSPYAADIHGTTRADPPDMGCMEIPTGGTDATEVINAESLITSNATNTFNSEGQVTDNALETVNAEGLITDNATQTINAETLIEDNATETINAESNITDNALETFNGESTIADNALETVNAEALVETTATETINGEAGVQGPATETINAESTITDNATGIINAESTVTDNALETVSAESIITDNALETVNAEANVQGPATETINAEVTVQSGIDTTETINAEVLITTNVEEVFNADGTITDNVLETINGEALVVVIATETVNAEALISGSATETVNAEVEIIGFGVESLDGKVLINVDEGLINASSLINKVVVYKAVGVESRVIHIDIAAGWPVYNGAEGFGIYTDVWERPEYRVTSTLSGPGSLSDIAAIPGPKTIRFDVSDVVLTSRLTITEPYTTIEGPVNIEGRGIYIQTHDVLLRNLRIRPGISEGLWPNPDDSRAIQIGLWGWTPESTNCYNVVVDQCTLQHATDQVVGINGCHDVTISRCMIAEGLLDTNNNRSYGLLAYDVHDLTIIKNAFIHNKERNPALSWDVSAVVANNIVYHPFREVMQVDPAQGEQLSRPFGARVAFQGNIIRCGPYTTGDIRDLQGFAKYMAWIKDALPDSRIYTNNNVDWNGPFGVDPFLLDAASQNQPDLIALTPPLVDPNTAILSSDQKLNILIATGCQPWAEHETRLFNDVIDGNTGQYISDPAQV